jgi:PncC family amidohydrolase
VPGSSEQDLGGVVSYSNQLKVALLGVPEALLVRYGAVSEPVALAMARGARERLGADISVSVTGIAGPGGGSEEKPVGLTFIGFSAPWGDSARKFIWGGDRLENKRSSAQAALSFLIEEIQSAS